MTRDLLIEKFNPSFIDSKGNAFWLNRDGIIHHDKDTPAVIFANGQLEWYKNGRRHRYNDKPAIIFPDGAVFWYMNGIRHRGGDKPAMVFPDGRMRWYENGRLIRRNIKRK